MYELEDQTEDSKAGTDVIDKIIRPRRSRKPVAISQPISESKNGGRLGHKSPEPLVEGHTGKVENSFPTMSEKHLTESILDIDVKALTLQNFINGVQPRRPADRWWRQMF